MDSKEQKAKYAKQSKIFLLISPLIAILGLFDYSKLKGTGGEVSLDSLTFTAQFLYHHGGEKAVLLGPLLDFFTHINPKGKSYVSAYSFSFFVHVFF